MAGGMYTVLRAGSVRRVLRRGDVFLCGLCRAEYHHSGAAQFCLTRCWQEFLETPAVIRRHAHRTLTYRCRFCARDYISQAEATRCAQGCKEAQIAAFQLEYSLLEASAEPASKTSSPIKRRPKLKLIVLQTPRSKRRAAAVEPSETDTPKTTGQDQVETSSQSTTPGLNQIGPNDSRTEPPKAVSGNAGAGSTIASTPLGEESHFSRSGASYICKNCQNKFFTKDEVEKCWLSHQNQAA